MILRGGDSAAGLLSGGCVEADLMIRASRVRVSHCAELVAEISAVISGRNAGFLRDLGAPIHDTLTMPAFA
jgi:hypothetical protein